MRHLLVFTTLYLSWFQTCFCFFNEPFSISGARTTSEAKSVPLEEVFRVGRYFSAFYCPKEEKYDCSKWNATLATYTTIENKAANTMAIVGVLKGGTEALVSYRGTQGVQDALLDLAEIAVEEQGGKFKFHLGLHVATMSVYDEVVRQIQSYRDVFPKINRILLTGYSLGGAMASITVFKLNYLEVFNRNMTYTLVTFGEPRVGNKDYAVYMNNLGIPIARVIARGDTIPHLPSTSVSGLPLLGSTYHHHHQEIWIQDKEMKKVTYCSKKVFEDPNCSNSLKMNYSIVDHYEYSKYFQTMNNKYGK